MNKLSSFPHAGALILQESADSQMLHLFYKIQLFMQMIFRNFSKEPAIMRAPKI
jgi:hypothetical protein